MEFSTEEKISRTASCTRKVEYWPVYEYFLFFSGDLERLRRFWLTGTCNPKKEEKKASEPLAPEQFISAFLLLLCGIFLAAGLMSMEHAYIKWVRGSVTKTDKAGCCALLSLVSAIFLKYDDDFELFVSQFQCLKMRRS